MANLKRNSIELMKEIKGDEVVTEKFWTPPFIPLSVVYEAADLMGEYEKKQVDENGKIIRDLNSQEVREYLEKMSEFVANRIYAGQFTKDDIEQRYHAPDAFFDLQKQIMFVAWGMQEKSAKKSPAKKD